uniref:Uncharacterized protein n=1 Tax=uncultured prokaryote TaxID=198431 RepID=A0A0H5Q306_9ZZZZ|nr:hypothetical protein [uncultured prokaryote]
MKNYGKYGKCTGRVEFNAARVEIEKLREQGYSLRRIFEHLVKHGRFSQTYVTFTRFVNGKPRKETCGRQKEAPRVCVTEQEQKQTTTPPITRKVSSGFAHFVFDPTTIDKDSLI